MVAPVGIWNSLGTKDIMCPLAKSLLVLVLMAYSARHVIGLVFPKSPPPNQTYQGC